MTDTGLFFISLPYSGIVPRIGTRTNRSAVFHTHYGMPASLTRSLYTRSGGNSRGKLPFPVGGRIHTYIYSLVYVHGCTYKRWPGRKSAPSSGCCDAVCEWGAPPTTSNDVCQCPPPQPSARARIARGRLVRALGSERWPFFSPRFSQQPWSLFFLFLRKHSEPLPPPVRKTGGCGRSGLGGSRGRHGAEVHPQT